MESMNVLRQSLWYLQQYAAEAEEALKNRQAAPHAYLALLAWTKYPPSSARIKREQDRLILDMQDRVAAVLRGMLRNTTWFASWNEQNPGQYDDHIASMVAAALQYIVRDKSLEKTETCDRLSDPASCNGGLVSLVVTIITRSHVLDSFGEFDRGAEIILRSAVDEGWADYDKVDMDPLNPQKKARCSDVHVSKRWRSGSSTDAERSAISRFFFPERESDHKFEDTAEICGEAVYTRHEPYCGHWDNPVLDGLMASESDTRPFVTVAPVPSTPAGLVRTMVMGVQERATTPRKVARAIADYPARALVRDRCITLALQGVTTAVDILLAIEDLADEGLRFGQRSAEFLRVVTDCLATVTPMSPQPQGAMASDTPEARLRYVPAEWPTEPTDIPPAIDTEAVITPVEASAPAPDVPVAPVAPVVNDALHPVGIMIPVAYAVVAATEQVYALRHGLDQPCWPKQATPPWNPKNGQKKGYAAKSARHRHDGAMDGLIVGSGPPGHAPSPCRYLQKGGGDRALAPPDTVSLWRCAVNNSREAGYG